MFTDKSRKKKDLTGKQMSNPQKVFQTFLNDAPMHPASVRDLSHFFYNPHATIDEAFDDRSDRPLDRDGIFNEPKLATKIFKKDQYLFFSS